MNKKNIKTAKVIAYTATVLAIIFSMLYLAKKHEPFVLPFLLGFSLFMLPFSWYIQKAEEKRPSNKPLNWTIYVLIVVGFLWSIYLI